MQALRAPASTHVAAAQIAISIDEPGESVSLSGQLSAATVADVRAVLMAAAENGTGDLVVDLGGVERIDASGLGMLVGAHRLALRRERRLVLRHVPPRIERLLAATRLNRVLTLDPAPYRAPGD